MSAITELPCEVIAAILRNLDNVQSLGPALLACRHFYASFKQYHGIEAAILRRQVTPALLPYSVALLEASPSSWPHSDLLDTLSNDPAQLSARVSSMPVSSLGIMARMHELIRSLATSFATEAWARLSSGNDGDGDGCGGLVPSPAEDFRFCRAFYRLELFYRLARGGGDQTGGNFAEDIDSWFFSRQPLWENEQIGCAHEFLEAKFCQACRDTIAHDVEFGEIGIDYLSVGRDNEWNQLWLSQGIEFCHRVTNADSYEAKRALLSTVFGSGAVNLPEALEAVPEGFSDDDTFIEDYTEEDLWSSVPHRDDSDLDKGPYEAWRAAHAGFAMAVCLMFEDNAWLRERGYVFWDWDRMQSIDLLGVIRSPPPEALNSHDITEQDWKTMRESFIERSKVWQSGGSGYWGGGVYVSR